MMLYRIEDLRVIDMHKRVVVVADLVPADKRHVCADCGQPAKLKVWEIGEVAFLAEKRYRDEADLGRGPMGAEWFYCGVCEVG